MKGLKQVIVLVLFAFSTSEAMRLKCEPVICPKCIIQLNETYEQTALKFLNSGPPDGSCLGTDVKYQFFGKDFGRSNNSCCCLPIAPTSPVQCTPRDPTVPECPNNLGIRKGELIVDYFQRVGRVKKDAPSNGCCRNGTFKYIYTKEFTGASHDICVCVIYNLSYAPPSSESESLSHEH